MTRVALVSIAACFALSVSACSGGHKGTTIVNGETPDGGDAGGPVVNGDQVTQRGIIVDYDTKKPVKGATITAAGQTVVSDVTGAYQLVVDKGQPFTMEVSMEGYAKLIEQETTIDADFDKGKTSFIATPTANLLLGTLDGYDATLGVLSVQLIPTGACASEDGATITVSPAGAALVKYLYAGIPSSRKGAVVAGQFPSAVVYNVQPGASVTVGATVANCTVAPFPITKDGVTYTGGITTEAGSSTSFERVFLQ